MPGKVLITGASGMIGGAVGAALVDEGRQVRALSRRPDRLAGIFRDTAPMPAPGAGADAWQPLLEGVSGIVHCAGIADAADADGEQALFDVHVRLSQDLAAATARHPRAKLVFLSSIHAAAHAPDAYGRSKLEAENAIRSAFAAGGRFTILRPAPVYGGRQARGNLGRLLRLAALPLPLPLGGLSARRSLLALDACVRAVDHVLSHARTDGDTYPVSDAHALTVAEILTALRHGLGRRPMLYPLPAPLLGRLAALAGRSADWERLAGSLVADPSRLAATGWRPEPDTAGRLARFAAGIRGRPGA